MAKEETDVADDLVDTVDNETDNVEDIDSDNEDNQSDTDGNDEQNQDEDGVKDAVAETDVVVIDGEEVEDTEEDTPNWVKEIRESNREKSKRIRELESKLEEKTNNKDKFKVGPKPKYSDFYGDDNAEEAYDAALNKWYEQKTAADNAIAEREQKKRSEEQAWNQRLDAYEQEKKSLKISNFEDKEEVVTQKLNTVQQGIMLSVADRPALMVAALGIQKDKLDKLSQIKDPLKFAAALGEFQKNISMKKRRATPPAPSRNVSGDVSTAGVVDSKLERLEREAKRTGDRTKVIRYKASIKKKNQA